MIQITTLTYLPLSYKVLFTGFLLVIGVGLLMAGFQIMETHGKADGKPASPSTTSSTAITATAAVPSWKPCSTDR